MTIGVLIEKKRKRKRDEEIKVVTYFKEIKSILEKEYYN